LQYASNGNVASGFNLRSNIMSIANEMPVNELYFEQYKILVNSYEALQTKRASINNFLIFMYSTIIGLYSFYRQH
jgi:hypothetical protein